MADGKEKMTIRLPKDLKDEVMQLADSLGISGNAIIVLATQAYMANQKRKTDESSKRVLA